MADKINIQAKFLANKYNPGNIQRIAIDILDEYIDGTRTIIDPTNPLNLLIENAAVMTAAAMENNTANMRRTYPIVANTLDDIYPHMSDVDYANLFSTPSQTRFRLMFMLSEVKERLVYDPNTGIKKLVIPRNTYFTVIGVKFSLQYPIEIRQQKHGGFTVVYDTSVESPLKILSTNVVDKRIVYDTKNNGGEWLLLEFDVEQFNIISKRDSVYSSKEFSTEITLTDNYYYARVFQENINSSTEKWDEIQTTHCPTVYNTTSPTAIITVRDKSVNIRIPQIYTNTGLINRKLRIDIYETKGPLEMILGDFTKDQFVVTYMDYNYTKGLSQFSSPLTVFNAQLPYSVSTVTGGSLPKTFTEIRDRVIRNSVGPTIIPITPDQITTRLDVEGYLLVKHVDHVTNRIYLATKPIPSPRTTKKSEKEDFESNDNELFGSAIGSIQTLNYTFNNLVGFTGVVNNNSSITLTSDVLYRIENGIVSLVDSQIVEDIDNATNDVTASIISNNSYLYTPFHYVLDASVEFEARPYYLDNPYIDIKQFIGENDTTNLQVNTAYYNITRTNRGYRIGITTLSDESFKIIDDSRIFVQLSFKPYNQNSRIFVNGRLVGKTGDRERAYEFDIITNYYVTKQHNLQIINFTSNLNDIYVGDCPLMHDFDIVFCTNQPMDTFWKISPIDAILGRHLLPNNTVGITHENLKVKLGTNLENLWSRAKTIISSAKYKTWDVDIPKTYDRDIIKRNADGSTINFDSEGNPSIEYLHRRGDVELDEHGNPQILYPAGDVMRDPVTGEPILISPRQLLRRFDLFLIEAAYKYATEINSVTYRNEFTHSIVASISEDLASIELEALEQTQIYYYPKNTLGSIEVMIEDGKRKIIRAAHKFRVKLYVTEIVFDDMKLRRELEKSSIQGISESLEGSTINIGKTREILKNYYGNDVIDFTVTGFGDDGSIVSMILMNEGDKCSIAKRLVSKGDGTLAVEEYVDIDFVKHQIKIT